ncbi:MAG: hypothetical protein Q9211_003117 [Gyalolechia sp. 1 TL-2023]
MEVQQSDHNPTIQDFLQWQSRAQKKGCRGSNNAVGAAYISVIALKACLTQTRIQGLLDALFDDADEVAPDAARVGRHYLRTFAILLSAGYGPMIRLFVERPSLQDRALPICTEPTDFPKATDCNLFERFYSCQWRYCALKLEYGMDYRLGDDYILPVLHKEERGRGGSAVVYAVTVDPDYNCLVPSNSSDSTNSSTTGLQRSKFALKTYRRNSEAEKYFENERTAYKRLRYHDRPHANIIGHYGSFSRDGTYNIILEYADRGTLNDYLQATHEPTSSAGIMTFWTQFLGILHGLTHIHGTPVIALDKPWVLLGWHHDLTPDNILVVSRNNASPYDCDFKIADFGLAHFQRFGTSTRDATDKDQHGSNAYSAPEAYRSTASERERLQVPQNVEIWSMGCILSEVATWVTEGMPKVLEYRRRRATEVHSKAATNEELFFHDYKVLDTVNQIHEEIKRNSRPADRITDAIIQRLVKGMMITDHQARASSKHFLDRSRQILDEARPAWSQSVADGAIDTNRIRLPPRMPPGHKQMVPLSLSSDQYPGRSVANSLPHRSSAAPVPGMARYAYQGETPELKRNSPEFSNPSSAVTSPRTSRETHVFSPKQLPGSTMADVSSPLPGHQMADSQPVSAREPWMLQNPAQDNRQDSPYMSVEEGLKTKRERDQKRHGKYAGEDLIRALDTVLESRDHVFLVDNAASMEPHKDQVRDVLELLSSLTARYDSNGLDLYFTTEPKKKYSPTSNRRVLELFDEHPPHSLADMRACLASILEPYQARFGQKDRLSWIRHPNYMPSIGPRKLSLYILTDGVWDPECDLIMEITTLAAGLQKEGTPKKPVSIQFILFGDNASAVERLEKLNSGLPLESCVYSPLFNIANCFTTFIPISLPAVWRCHTDLTFLNFRDIVDTTPATGNVWKMLLGPLNPWIDDDRKRHLHVNGAS